MEERREISVDWRKYPIPPRASRTRRWFLDGIETLPVNIRKMPIRRNAKTNLMKRSACTPTPLP